MKEWEGKDQNLVASGGCVHRSSCSGKELGELSKDGSVAHQSANLRDHR